MAQVRVRFAPSPTGYLHIGGARTALFNYLFAKRNGGKFVLRVEDTDTERTVEDSAEKMMQAFRWLGLQWDEGPIVGGPAGPYYQSERQELYKKYAESLLAKGHAYKCYCTPEELKEEREKAMADRKPPRYSGRCKRLTAEEIARFEDEGRKPTIRLLTPDSGTTVVNDLIKGDVSFSNDEIADWIIMKSDGLPTYNFACVIDDWLMGITHVIRADEHLSNTPKQMMVYTALSAPMPKFAHVPMILAKDRSKLSKRHGAQTVEEFREQGYFPEALLNYIALLGWTHPEPTREILSLDDMVEAFDLGRVSSTAAVYDTTKLSWMNGHYLRMLEPDDLLAKYLAAAIDAGFGTEEELSQKKNWLKDIALSFQERVRTIPELVQSARFYFQRPATYDPKGDAKIFGKPGVSKILRDGAKCLSKVGPWDIQSVEKAYRDLIEAQGIKSGDLIHPTRLALTGVTVGPGLFDVIHILGKDESVARLNMAADYVERKSL